MLFGTMVAALEGVRLLSSRGGAKRSSVGGVNRERWVDAQHKGWRRERACCPGRGFRLEF
jgi:hypothetical protein